MLEVSLVPQRNSAEPTTDLAGTNVGVLVAEAVAERVIVVANDLATSGVAVTSNTAVLRNLCGGCILDCGVDSVISSASTPESGPFHLPQMGAADRSPKRSAQAAPEITEASGMKENEDKTHCWPWLRHHTAP